MFIYNNEIRKQEIKIPWCGPTQFYSKGMVIARQSYPSTEETLICAFNSIISKENITKILSLDATDITFYLSYMFNTSYSFSAPNLCLTGNTLNVNDYYGNCRIPKNISKKYIYEFDIIITSKEILPENYDTLLKEYFPERKKVINHILSVWEECKREFMLKEIINYPIDKNCRKNEFSNLYVYVKKS